MNKKNIYLRYIVIFFLGGGIIGLTYNNISKLTLKTDRKSLTDEFKNFYEFQLRAESKSIPQEMAIFNDKSQIITLSNLIGNSPKIILKYSELGCSVCIDKQIENLKKVSQKIGNQNIIILASYRQKKNLILFKRLNKLNFEIYNMKEQEFGLVPEQYHLPYFFIIDSTMQMKYIFIPSKDLPELSEVYFRYIIEKFFHKY
ncbi:MAG: redoxin domain-containing protein [Ignavibacteriales bacterium]|nr:redoxin domain-containing protein [Ignavibacteriales bacterium]